MADSMSRAVDINGRGVRVEGRGVGVGSGIPDSGLDHLWWGPSISNISTYPDEEGSLDMSAVGGPQLSDINGNQSASYDGNDDAHTVGSSLALGASNEWTAVVVIDPTDDGRQQVPFSMGSSSSTSGGYDLQFRYDNGGYQISHAGTAAASGGSIVSGAQVLVLTYDGVNAILDVNGSEQINASISEPNTPQERTDIARSSAFGGLANAVIGAVGHEAAAADATRRDDLTNTFADEFGITI